MATVTASPIIQLHPDDNVVVAKTAFPPGTTISVTQIELTTRAMIPAGHKIASRSISEGEPIRKYGQVIGFARGAIHPGDHVHTHNVVVSELTHDYAFSTAVPEPPAPITGRTFEGYRRADGRAATRNYVAILSTVNCSATTAKYVAQQMTDTCLADFPNIDGVIALTHKVGCGMEMHGAAHNLLERTLAGFARHPNIAAYLLIGLGCETAQPSFIVDGYHLVQLGSPGQPRDNAPLVMSIQEQGGVAKTVKAAKAALMNLLPAANSVQREPIPVSELILATECGGSDAYSGIGANPAVGYASDLLVAHGGTAILGEVTEMYGAEHMLTRRAVTPEVGQKLIDRIRWWEDYARKFGCQIDNNPSVGNKQGGLTTIYEKSLGAIAKGGTTALQDVYEYAQPVTQKGFVVMDTPGFDSVSVTGMIAGGANLCVFTTGRGSCFGCKPVPTLKVASNTPMFERMTDDMDLNAGRILEEATVEEVGREIFERLIAVASGEQTKSEAQGIGDEEFSPWNIGPIF